MTATATATTGSRRARSRRAKFSAGALLLVIGFLVVSIVSFITDVSRYGLGGLASIDTEKADGIVVLTGGDHRLVQGLRLLEQGHGKRLLVSGVHPETSREMLRRAHNVPRNAMLACCMDLGYSAGDTIGNASETRSWVERNGFRSLLVVTANYHMPRSLAELEHVMPGVRLIAHPVDPRAGVGGPWWADAGMVRVMGREYLKFLRCQARMRMALLKDRTANSVTPGETVKGATITGLEPI
jgi:uncharacterized SAM-binding protein YcdF (DUF218 family)